MFSNFKIIRSIPFGDNNTFSIKPKYTGRRKTKHNMSHVYINFFT